VAGPRKNRFEIKYLVPLNQGFEVLNALRHHMRLDPHAGEERHYVVRSLYFDTHDLDGYCEVREGERHRQKFRIRKYTADAEQVSFEVKHKINRLVWKDRFWVEARRAGDLYRDPWSAAGTELEPIAYAFARVQHRPTVTTVYQRVPLEDLLGTDTRVTLDYNLRCGGPDLLDRELKMTDPRILPPGFGIIEVKYNLRIPNWLFRVMREYELVATTYSKYRQSVERIFDDTPLIAEVDRNGRVTEATVS